MPPPIANPESLEELPFPMHGLNLIVEFESQPQGTTPVGKNVRAYETLTQRNRGGSRPGLVEYINSQVLGFPSKIQHLNIIVDPTTAALIGAFDDPEPTVEDPSTNNLSIRNPLPHRRIRRGGSAKQPNRNKVGTGPAIFSVTPPAGLIAGGDMITIQGKNMGGLSSVFNFGPGNPAVTFANNGTTATVKTPASVGGAPGIVDVRVTVPGVGTSPITAADHFAYGGFVQGNSQAFPGTGSASESAAYTSNVTKGDLLLVCVFGSPNGTGAQTVSLTDTLGNTYTQIGTYVVVNSGNWSGSLWRAISVKSGANTVTVSQSNNPVFADISEICLLEYAGVPNLATDGTSTNAVDPTVDTSRTTGLVPIAGMGELLFGVFFDQALITPAAGFTERLGPLTNFTTVIDWVNVPTGAMAVTGTTAAVELHYAAIGASFKMFKP